MTSGVDQFGESVLRILGNLEGKIDGLLREQSRQGGQIEQHLADDRDIHARQDDRLLDAIREVASQFATEQQRTNSRLDAVREESQRQQGARANAEKWRLGIMWALGTASGYFGGLFSRWPAGHH